MSLFRFFVVKLLRRFARVFGAVLLSKQVHAQILSQRARAVEELVKQESLGLRQGVVGVVLSKDRALQLYTLLHTYFKYVENPAPLFVIYQVSNEAHAAAYQEVEAAYGDQSRSIKFVPEGTSFRASLQTILEKINTNKTFFLVDDIVFIRPLDLNDISAIDPKSAIFSFRHSPHLRRSYTANVKQLPPKFFPSKISPALLEFKWFEQGNEWSDPWSLDGQVLSTAEIRVLTRISDFKAPNTYEAALKVFNDIARNRVGICYTESKTLNLPINRVQNEVSNLSGNVSPEFLLAQWNNGMMLDTSSLDTHIPLAPHEEHVITFKRRA